MTSILNFAPVVLTVPRGVSLRKVDLAVELQILSFYQQRRTAAPGGSGGTGHGWTWRVPDAANRRVRPVPY